MGVKDWWAEAMGTFHDLLPEYLSVYSGKRLAVDVSIILYKHLRTDADKFAATSTPAYKCGNLLQSFIMTHRMLSKWIVPVYVFDGIPPDVKLEEKARRSGLKQKSGKDYLTLLERAKENTSLSFSKTELEKAFKARKNMACPTNLD